MYMYIYIYICARVCLVAAQRNDSTMLQCLHVWGTLQMVIWGPAELRKDSQDGLKPPIAKGKHHEPTLNRRIMGITRSYIILT